MSVAELVVDEVQRPEGVGPRLDQDLDPGARSLPASPPFADGDPFLRIELLDPVDTRMARPAAP